MYRRNNDYSIYVGNLPSYIQKNDIEDLFLKYGTILQIDLKRRQESSFAFLRFEDKRDAYDAVHARSGFKFNDKRLVVEFSESRRQDISNIRHHNERKMERYRISGTRRTKFRVLVTGLPSTGSWQDLKDHMRNAGEVSRADVHRNGYGIVEFLRYKDMRYAIKHLDGSCFRSHQKQVSFIRVKQFHESLLTRRYGRSSYSRRTRGSPTYSPYRRKCSSSSGLSNS